MRVAIIMGSTSDLPKVEPAITILKDFGVEVDVRCLSAHRAHKGLSAFIEETDKNKSNAIIIVLYCINYKILCYNTSIIPKNSYITLLVKNKVS